LTRKHYRTKLNAVNVHGDRRVVQLDAAALLRVRASQVLAVTGDVFASGVELSARAPGKLEPTAEGVAVLRIDGPLAQRSYAESACGYIDGYDAITARLYAALGDSSVGAAVLVIDSPGGDAAGLEEAIGRMRAARESSGKPVFAYVDELAASAAYWIAATVADKIYVPAMGAVGSIGCIGAIVDSSDMLEQQGMKVTLIRDPDGKAESHPAGVISDLAIERQTAVVAEYTSRFVAAVGHARGIDAAALRELNGAVLHGAVAVRARLADKVGSLEQTIRSAAKAGAKAQRDREEMQMKRALRIELGLEDDASDAEAMASVKARGAKGDFADAVIKLTGADDQDTAMGRLEAWRENASAAAELADLRQQRARDAVASRLDAAIRNGKMTPAEAWAQDVDGAPMAGTPDGRWSSWSDAQLSEYVELRPQLVARGVEHSSTPNALTDREVAICKDTGCDPDQFAKLKAARSAGRLGTT
jgi:ClpP class serine protease